MINSLETRRIGTHELQLPTFMATLPQNVIDNFSSYECKIISCGIDPNDGGLYMVTPEPQVKVLCPNGNMVPVDAFPSHDGELIAVSFQSIEGYYGIKSDLALSVAKSCVSSAGLFIGDTYMCNLELTDVQVATEPNEADVK